MSDVTLTHRRDPNAPTVLEHAPGCPKCGGNAVTVEYVMRALGGSLNSDHARTRHVDGEALRVTCCTCQFTWTEPTQDATPSTETASKPERLGFAGWRKITEYVRMVARQAYLRGHSDGWHEGNVTSKSMDRDAQSRDVEAYLAHGFDIPNVRLNHPFGNWDI